MEKVERKEDYNSYPNRMYCSVLDEMRETMKTHNFSYLPGLIEELQTIGNRMESALDTQNDLQRLTVELGDLKVEYKTLIKQYNELVDKTNAKIEKDKTNAS